MVEMTMTPYQYTYQNPINYTDPTGMIPGDPENGETRSTSSGGTEVYDDGSWHKTIDPVVVEGKRRSSGNLAARLYGGENGSATTRLQQAIRSDPATRDIDRTLAETISWIPGAESMELQNAYEDYENEDYWGAGFSAFASIPLVGKLGKLFKLGKSNIGKTAVKLGAGVMTNLGETLGKFAVPKYYTYITKGGKGVYVSPHAMKHLEELAEHGAGNPRYLRLLGQVHLQSINSAIDDILSQGAIQYNKMYISGGSEIMFGAPRAFGELPAVKHFRSIH